MVCYRRDMYMVYVQIIQRTEKNILKIRSPVYQREVTHLKSPFFAKLITVNNLTFAVIIFHDLVFRDNFASIYFRGL